MKIGSSVPISNERVPEKPATWTVSKSKVHFKDVLHETHSTQTYQNLKCIPHTQTKNIKSSEKETDFSFFDVLDMVNPLQHIPLLNLAYRSITGDSIKSISKIIGAAVFSGPIGAFGGLIDVIVYKETGQDISSRLFNLASMPPESKPELASLALEKPTNGQSWVNLNV